jgi:transposase
LNVLKPHLQTTIATLLASNTSHRQIERVTGIDRKTIRTYAKRIEELQANSSGVATGTPDQVPPPRPPAQAKLTSSICEPYRTFIEVQLRFKRNYMAIYQDLVDTHGFTGACNAVKRFAGGLCKTEPEQFDRLEFAPGEEAQVDYGEGALTRVPGSERYRKPRLFVMTLRYSRRSYSKGGVEVQPGNLGSPARRGVALFWWCLPLRGVRQPQGRRDQTRPVRTPTQCSLLRHPETLRRSG